MKLFGSAKKVEEAKALETVASFTTVDVAPYEEWYAREGFLTAGVDAYDGYTGRSVTTETSLEAAAVYAAVKVLGEDVGSLPFFTMRRTGDSVEKYRDHWLWYALHGMVNPDVSSGEFVEAMTATAALTGDAVAKKERYSDGRYYLWQYAPGTVNIQKDRRGRTVYEIARRGQSDAALGTDDVFHVRGFSFNGTEGDKVLRRARRLIGLSLTAQEFAGRNFSNGVHSDLFFKHPGQLGPDGVEGVLKAWREKQGVAKAGEPAVLQEGMDAVRLPSDMRKQQLHEARTFQVIEVCRIWRIQPHKLAQLDRATFNNIEELQRDHVVNTLRHWCRRWREAVHRHLLTDMERMEDRIFAQLQVEALQEGDFKTQTEGFSKLLEKGVYSINEVRRFLNLNPVDGGDGHYIQLNMQQVATAAKQATIGVMREFARIAEGRRREEIEETIARLEAA